MKITTKTIKALNPCASGLDNFLRHYPEFDGTHDDFLALEKISHEHKLWVLLRLMPRFEVEVFAIDCAIAANAAYYAASYAADAADAVYAVNAATYAANAAAHAAANAAYHTADAADAAERERQLDAICYLINTCEE